MNVELVGVIPVAGKGIRLFPKSSKTNKALLMVDDQTILERNISIMRDNLGIRVIYILVGSMRKQVEDFLKNRNLLGAQIVCINVNNINDGLACGLLEMKKYISGTFCVILGDEVYQHSNHSELLELLDIDFSAVCAVKEVRHKEFIKKNYSVEIKNGLITSLVEKPALVTNHYLGCGTYLFRPSLFDYIKLTPISPRTKKIELTDVINLIANKTNKVYPFKLKGGYANVNSIADYNTANYMVKSANFAKKKISLVIPAYNEESSIGYVIDDFKNRVDEILVINNNSEDNTESVAKEKGAKVITGNFKGYGHALRFGMDNAEGDILILCEADGSFLGRDLEKILIYLKDADFVLGTRTTKQMIDRLANMNALLRLGNVFMAKLIELLWIYKGGLRLTDVGCTFRGIWKSSYLGFRDKLIGDGPEFAPEMIIEALYCNNRIIEIPVTYSSRIGGRSKFSGNILANTKTALRMLKLIISKRLRQLF